MSLAIIYTRANVGVEAPLVTVEVHLSKGLPGFSIVGLPETAVKESKERVRSAIMNTNLEFPAKRITVNLAPAELPKSGGRFDLAIAVGILAASGQFEVTALDGVEFLGELALSGEVRNVAGILPGIIAAKSCGRTCIIPVLNNEEASLLKGAKILTCGHLLEVCAHFQGEKQLLPPEYKEHRSVQRVNDFNDVIGQGQAKRALMIAAAGGHNLLMRGPPGTGKTMLASRISTIMPQLSDEQAVESAVIRSLATGYVSSGCWKAAPFRAPHHTSSSVALIGGGSTLSPGEISMAHNGILFLDELAEFSPKALEGLREPMESGYVSISRANYQVRLPACFQLIAAMNPCPCGYYGDSYEECSCSDEKIKRYQSRISGPLLDRIDLHIDVPRLNKNERLQLRVQRSGMENNDNIIEDVTVCREKQLRRAGLVNAKLNQKQINQYCSLSEENEKFLDDAVNKLSLSTRAYFRILKIARTIADFNSADTIEKQHLLEAINYRSFDRRR